MIAALTCALLTTSSAPLWGYLNTPNTHPESLFDIPPHLKKRVSFWQNIFAKYGDDVMILHDRNHPWIIVDYIFFDKLSMIRSQDQYLNREYQSRIVENYQKRYQLALDRLSEEKKHALRYGAPERRIFKAYSSSHRLLKKLYAGSVKLRVQRGLADSFLSAAHTAQDYLPYFEKEFRKRYVPTELARLAFVESMFNPRAISKVGASGMWQFMKSTARSFMKVNREIDERHSPFKAAEAAAKMLHQDYKALGSWPLAITAYNHGRGGMKRAVQQTRSRQIHHIITRYKSPTFGFASQNFYAEFLAAHHAYEYLIKHKKINIRPSRLDIAAIHLAQPTRIKDLSKVLRVHSSVLEELNQCIKPQTYKYRLSYVLPKNYRLYIPRSAALALHSPTSSSLAYTVP